MSGPGEFSFMESADSIPGGTLQLIFFFFFSAPRTPYGVRGVVNYILF